MSQQINLLIQKQRRPAVSGERTAIALALLLAASLTYAFVERNKTAKVFETLKRTQAQVAKEKVSLKALEQKLAERPKPIQLAAEVAGLREIAANKRRVLETLRTGIGGSESGYHAHLMTLAKISENGVWLDRVQISNAGKSMMVAGSSLNPEAVLRYAQRLNEQFGPIGAQFTTVELSTPFSADPARGLPPIVNFTLH